ncbi:MAG TPA: MFS transporter [Moheibacter sp.]|nr:MFS transporter [Moheibacter sp.]
MKLFKIYADSFRGLSSESWMLAVVMLINRSGSMVLPFLGVYMTDHLGFSLESAGLILSFFGIGSVLGSWLGGWVTDKIGEFKVQSLSLLLSVPLFCLIPIFKTELGLAMIILLQSTVSEFFRPANSVAVARYAKKGNITRSFSLNRMAVNLGFSIGPAMGGILSMISYDFLFYSNAAGAFVAALVYIWFFRNRTHRNEKVEEEVDEVSISPYRDYKYLLFAFLCMLFSVCFFQLLNTLTIFYKTEAKLSARSIGFILGYSGFIIVLMEMLLVQIADKRFRLKFTLFLGTILCGISFAILGLSSSLFVIILGITILSVGEIWTLPFMSTITALRSGANNKGAYMGLLGIGFSLSFVITPYVGTYIAQERGFTTLWFGTGVLMALTAIGFYLVIPWMLGDKQNEEEI